MNNTDIQTLADLSRLHLSSTEIESYAKDFEGILQYINTIQSIGINQEDETYVGTNTNYLREDTESYSSGEFSENLLQAAPQRDGDFIKVQKIL
jgi:aspartyl/glutamyl-tRNA(Asn/Gln) amidotransferase C subunit